MPSIEEARAQLIAQGQPVTPDNLERAMRYERSPYGDGRYLAHMLANLFRDDEPVMDANAAEMQAVGPPRELVMAQPPRSEVAPSVPNANVPKPAPVNDVLANASIGGNGVSNMPAPRPGVSNTPTARPNRGNDIDIGEMLRASEPSSAPMPTSNTATQAVDGISNVEQRQAYRTGAKQPDVGSSLTNQAMAGDGSEDSSGYGGAAAIGSAIAAILAAMYAGKRLRTVDATAMPGGTSLDNVDPGLTGEIFGPEALPPPNRGANRPSNAQIETDILGVSPNTLEGANPRQLGYGRTYRYRRNDYTVRDGRVFDRNGDEVNDTRVRNYVLNLANREAGG